MKRYTNQYAGEEYIEAPEGEWVKWEDVQQLLNLVESKVVDGIEAQQVLRSALAHTKVYGDGFNIHTFYKDREKS